MSILGPLASEAWMALSKQILAPLGRGIGAVRFIIYIVSVPRESLARFDPPGMGPGTLSPGFGPGPDRAGGAGAPDIIFDWSLTVF